MVETYPSVPPWPPGGTVGYAERALDAPAGDSRDNLITVVISTRNRCARLRRCLAGLISLPERPSIIVVDNGSTDNTVAMVRLRFPGIGLIPLAENLGAVARNIGVAEAATPVVAFADDDSGWAPGSLAAAVRLMRRHSRLSLIAARVLVGPDRRPDPIVGLMASAPLGTEPDRSSWARSSGWPTTSPAPAGGWPTATMCWHTTIPAARRSRRGPLWPSATGRRPRGCGDRCQWRCERVRAWAGPRCATSRPGARCANSLPACHPRSPTGSPPTRGWRPTFG